MRDRRTFKVNIGRFQTRVIALLLAFVVLFTSTDYTVIAGDDAIEEASTETSNSGESTDITGGEEDGEGEDGEGEEGAEEDGAEEDGAGEEGAEEDGAGEEGAGEEGAGEEGDGAGEEGAGAGEEGAGEGEVEVTEEGADTQADESPQTVSLSYNSNGGSGSMDNTSGVVGDSVTVSECEYTYEGYTFSSWNTSEDGSGSSYSAGDSVTMPEGGMTLYAQWNAVIRLLGSSNNASVSDTQYKLYAKSENSEYIELSSDTATEFSYDSSLSFKAEVISDSETETYDTGLTVYYADSIDSLPGNNTWGSPSVGDYYLYFMVEDEGIVPDKAVSNYKISITDNVAPVITEFSYSTDDQTIALKATDLGAGVNAYALSVENSDPDWISVTSDDIGNGISVNYTELEAGTYYLYVKDASGNVVRSDKAINVTKLTINDHYESENDTDPTYAQYYATNSDDSAPSATFPNAISRNKFDFGGYYSSSDYSDESPIAAGANVTLNAGTDNKYYAKWTLKNVEFSANLEENYEKNYDGTGITLSVALSQEYDSLSWTWYHSDSEDGTYSAVSGADTSELTIKNASDSGYYYAVANITEDGTISTAQSKKACVTINRIELQIDIDDKEIVYGSAADDFTMHATSGLIDGETIETVFGSDYADKLTTNYTVGSSVGTYDITQSGLSADNYNVTFTSGTLTVTGLAVTDTDTVEVTLEADSYAYTGHEIIPNVTSVVVIHGEDQITLTEDDYTVSCTDNVSVGTASVVITFKGNFTGEYSKKTFEITKATYDVTAYISESSWKYGETPDNITVGTSDVKENATVTYKYLKKGEEDSFEAADKTGAFTTMPTDAGTYYVWAELEATASYDAITSSPAEFTISKREITLTSATKSWTYDGNPHTAGDYTETGDGFVEGEGFHSVTVSGSVTTVSEGEVDNNIEYKLTTATRESNYDITVVTGKLSITQAPLPKIESLKWSSTPGSLQWVAITRDGLNITYEVKLYRKGDSEDTLVSTITTSETTLALRETILNDSVANGVAGYTATITAKIATDDAGMYNNYTEGTESDKIANKYTAKVKLGKNGGDQGVAEDPGVDSLTFTTTYPEDVEDKSVTYLLQGEGVKGNVTFVNGYENDDDGSVFNYTTGSTGLSKNAYSSGGYYISFTSSQLDSAVDATLAVKTKDSAPICVNYSGSQAEDYSYVQANIEITDELGLLGYKIIASDVAITDDNWEAIITDDNWIEITQIEQRPATYAYITSQQFSAAGNYYLAFKDVAGNIRYNQTPITVYELSFDPNGGTGTMSTIYKLKDSSVIIPGNKFTKAGYAFTNWTAGTSILPNGASYVKNESVTFVAGWTNKKFSYSINYYYQVIDTDTDGNIVFSYPDEPNSTVSYTCAYGTTVNYNDSAVLKDKEGYVITNSPTLTEGSSEYASSITVTEDGMALDVYYNLKQYTMTYTYTDYDMATERTITDSFYYGQKFNAHEKPSQTGYTFIGWNYGDAGSAPVTMPANNLTATGYFKADTVSYIIRYYFESIDTDNPEGNYLGSGFALDSSVQADETVSADYGKTIKAYVSSAVSDSMAEVVSAREITGFTPVAVAVTNNGSEAKSFDLLADLNSFAGDSSNDSAEGVVHSESDGTGITYVSFYYTRNTYKLSLNVYKGAREDGVYLYGAHFDGTVTDVNNETLNDGAIWTFPYGYVFPSEGDYSAAWFETYNYASEGYDTNSTKNHSVAWTKRWGSGISKDKYYLANFVDWSTGSRPTTMPAGDVTVVREYASMEQSKYTIDVYVEDIVQKTKTNSDGDTVTYYDAGKYRYHTSYDRYTEPGVTVTIVTDPSVTTAGDNQILVADLMTGIDRSDYYEYSADHGRGDEVLTAVIKENQLDVNQDITDDSVTKFKVYISRKKYTSTIKYIKRDVEGNETNFATYTISQKWGTSYGVDSAYYFDGTKSSEVADSCSSAVDIANVTSSSIVDSTLVPYDYSTNNYVVAWNAYYYFPKNVTYYTSEADTDESGISSETGISLGEEGGHWPHKQYTSDTLNEYKTYQYIMGTNNTYANVYYVQQDPDRHYVVRLQYETGDDNGTYTPLVYTNSESEYNGYEIWAANIADITAAGLSSVQIEYSGTTYDTDTTAKTTTFYVSKNKDRLYYPVEDNRFYLGNYAEFSYGNNIGRETFDADTNQPSEDKGEVYRRVNSGAWLIKDCGTANPITVSEDDTLSNDGYVVDFTAYYYDTYKNFYIIYYYNGSWRGKTEYDYGTVVGDDEELGCSEFSAGDGYEIVWYLDSQYTQRATTVTVTEPIKLYGQKEPKPIENWDYAYYQMPDGTYYTMNSLPTGYTTEEKTIDVSYKTYTKKGTQTNYYYNGNLIISKTSNFAPAFTEFTMDYTKYLVDGFEYDDKNTSNKSKAFCGKDPVNMHGYYARTSALLTIRRRKTEDEVTINDETTTKVNGITVNITDPTREGYTFKEWYMYDYSNSTKKDQLSVSDYGYSHTDKTDESDGYTEFKMPICDTLLWAQWEPAEIPFKITHLFQDSNKAYRQELLEQCINNTVPEGTTVRIVTDIQEGVVLYYLDSISENNLFAIVETLSGIKSEQVLNVNDYDCSSHGTLVSFVSGNYEYGSNSKTLAAGDTFEAYHDAEVTYYYERNSNINIYTDAYCVDGASNSGLTLSGEGSYYYGQEVNLHATMEPTGYTFLGWYKVNDGTNELSSEQIASLDTLVSQAGTEGAVLSKVTESTEQNLNATVSTRYIAISQATDALKPDITVTLTRNLETSPLYYNYQADAENQFNASVTWPAGEDSSANNIKSYKWYYCKLTDVDTSADSIQLSDMTAIEDSNTSTFNLPTGYDAGSYVIRCVAEIERQDNGKTQTAYGSYKFDILPNETYLETTPVENQSYTGQEYTYTENWIYEPESYKIYYSESDFAEEFNNGVTDLSSRISADDEAKVYETIPKYKDVNVDSEHNPIPHVVYYYVVSSDPNYASITGSSSVGLLPVPVTVTAVKAFTKIYDATETIQGKPDNAVGTVTYKSDNETYSDYYRLQSGIESEGATRSPYYKINGILAADSGKVMMLNFDATFDYKHASGSGIYEGTIVTLSNLGVLTSDSTSELNKVYENWNYVFPEGETLQLSGQIKPYPLDIKWLPVETSDVDETYQDSDFTYNYTGSPQAPYIKIISTNIPDSTDGFSVAVKNKQTNAGTYSAIPEVEANESAEYYPTDYSFTIDNQTYTIKPRYLKVYPKDVEKTYNASNQTMLDTLYEFRFETKETADGTYVEYTLPDSEHYNVSADKSYKDAGTYSDITARNFTVYTLDESGKKSYITDNYKLEYGSGTLTIKKCPVVVDGITGVDKEYDGTVNADLEISGASIKLESGEDIYSGDTLSLVKLGYSESGYSNGYPGEFDNKNVGTGKTVTISYYDGSGTDGSGVALKETGSYLNYEINATESQQTTTAAIIKNSKVNVKISAQSTEVIYGETGTVTSDTFAHTFTGFVLDTDGNEENDIEITSGYPKFKLKDASGNDVSNEFDSSSDLTFIGNLDVGTYQVYFVEKTDDASAGKHLVEGLESDKYNVSWDYENPATITVVPRQIEVVGITAATESVPAVTKSYDGTTTVSDEAKATIIGDKASHPYYKFTKVDGSDVTGVLSRDAESLVIAGFTAAYDDKNVATTSDNITIGATKVLATSATLGGDKASNYELINNTFSVPGAITPITLTVYVNNQTVTYGSDISAYEFTIDGAIEADKDTILAGLKNTELTQVNSGYEAVESPSDGNSHDAGYYALNVDTDKHYTNPNYVMTFPVSAGSVGQETGLLTVNKKELTYKAKEVYISYGVQNPPTIYDGEFDTSGFVYGDTIATQKEDGQKAKIVSGNMVQVFTDESLNTDAGTYEVEFTCDVSSDSLPGTYAVTPGNVASGEGGLYTKNYNIVAQSGNLIIKKFYILVEGVEIDSKVYDGTTTVDASKISLDNATFSYYVGATAKMGVTYQELKSAFSETVDPFDTTGFNAVYEDKNVGDNKKVTFAIKLNDNSNLAKRYILLTKDNQSEALGYVGEGGGIFGDKVSQTSAESSITARPLTLKPSDITVNYGQGVNDEQIVVTGVTYATGEGFVGEENLETIDFVKNYKITPDGSTTEYEAGSDTGEYVIDISSSTPGAGVHGNYNISFATGKLTVNPVTFPAPSEISWNAGVINYEAVANIGNVAPAGYELVLYKAGSDTPVMTVNCNDGTSYDFTDTIRSSGQGVYSVKIRTVAGTDNNAGYKNVSQYSEQVTSSGQKAILVTPVFNNETTLGSEDTITQYATNTKAKKEVYVGSGDHTESFVVIAGEEAELNAYYEWAGTSVADNTGTSYNTGYAVDSFTASASTGVTLETVTDNSASGNFTGKVSVTDDIETTSINLILKLKKRAAEGILTINGDSDTAPYGATYHTPYSADVTHTDTVENNYSYTYEWYYLINGLVRYDSSKNVKDVVKTVDSSGNVVEEENAVIWNAKEFTFPRGKRAQSYEVHCKVIATRKDNGEQTTLDSSRMFTITKPTEGDPNSLVLTVSNWNYGQARVPATCTPLFGDDMGAVTIYYRTKGQGDDSWVTTVPTEAGTYEVRAESAGSDNYPAVISNTREFTISRVKLETPSDFEMNPDGNGTPYGLLTWNAVSGYQENAGTDSASTVTVSYEIKILIAPKTETGYGEERLIATKVVTDTELNILEHIDEDGRYIFRIRALADPRTDGTDNSNINCDDSEQTEVNTPIIGAKVTTDIEGDTKVYDGDPITITAGYSDGSDESSYEFKWYKNGAEIQGATSRTYQITEANDTGYYSAAVKSAGTGDDWISSKKILVTIEKRPVEIKAASYEKDYDNTYLTKAGTYTLSSSPALTEDLYSISYKGDDTKEALVKGAGLTSLTFAGEIRDAGTESNTPSGAIIINSDGDKTSNYDITYTAGVLEVNKIPATITAPSDTKIYDGTELTAPGIGDGITDDKKVTVTGLLTGHQITFVSMTSESKITDAGSCSNVVDTGSIVIADTEDNNRVVSGNYDFSKIDGTLTITKAPASIVASDAAFVYDGTSKTITATMRGTDDNEGNDEFKNATLKYALVTDGSVGADSEVLTYIHAGTYTIRVSLAESSNHLAAEPVDVTLTISQRPLNIKAVTKSKEYDGTPHSVEDTEYTVTNTAAGEGLVNGDRIASVDVFNDGNAKRVGETESSQVRNAVIRNTSDAVVSGDYAITYDSGELSFSKRTITITLKDQSKGYDGSALTIPSDVEAIDDSSNDYYTVGGKGLVEGDRISSLTVSGSQTAIGESEVTATGAVIKSGETDVSGCYNVTYVKGKLTVTGRSITVKAADRSKTYDGTALSYSGAYEYPDESYVIIGGDGLAEGDEVASITLSGSQKDVGESDIVPGNIVIKNGDTDNTGNYSISYENGEGTLKVNKREVTIKASSADKTYDGTALTSSDVETVTGLVDGHVISAYSMTSESTITDAGVQNNVIDKETVKIKDSSDNDVTGNYEVITQNGTLTVAKAAASIEAEDMTVVYDGTKKTIVATKKGTGSNEVFKEAELKYTLISPENIDGDTQGDEGNPLGYIHAGTYTIRVSLAESSNHLAAEPVDVTLTISQRPLNIKAVTKSKEYDGTPHSVEDTEYTVTNTAAGEGIVNGDRIASVDVFNDGNAKRVGETESSQVRNAVIKNTIDAVVSGDYAITYEDGELSFTTRSITIKAKDHTKSYDGKALTAGTPVNIKALSDEYNDYYSVGGSGLADGDTVSEITISGSITDAGSTDAVPSGVMIANGNDDVTSCYTISAYDNGKLTVNKRKITLTAKDHIKEYDGTAFEYSGNYEADDTLYSISGEGLAEGDMVISFNLAGNQLGIGESAITPSDLLIRNGEDDNTGNYDITYKAGKLAVLTAGLNVFAKDSSKTYDGTALTYEGKDFEDIQNQFYVTGLADGDTVADIELNGTITHVGETELVPGNIRIMRGSTDVTDTYNINYVNGKLEVTKREITVKADDLTGTYGDEPGELTYSVISGEEVYEGDADIRYQCAVDKNSDVGIYAITLRAESRDYDVTCESGTYEVTPKAITIKADNETKKYEPGLDLTGESYTVSRGSLADGDEIESVRFTGNQTGVGTSDNVPSDAVIMKDGRNVSSNYDITYENGTLTVEKGIQEIIAEDLELEYDGKIHTTDEIIRSLKYDDGSEIDCSGEILEFKNAGKMKVTLSVDENDLYEGASKDVNVIITKRKITIAADSATKVDDGQPLNKTTWSIVKGSLAEGDLIDKDSLTVAADNKAGALNEVGTVTNKLSGQAVIRHGDEDVTANYEITYENGELTITEKPEESRQEEDHTDNNPGNSKESGSSEASSSSSSQQQPGSNTGNQDQVNDQQKEASKEDTYQEDTHKEDNHKEDTHQEDDSQENDSRESNPQESTLQGNNVQGNNVQGNVPFGSALQGNNVQGNNVQENAPFGSTLQGNNAQGNAPLESNLQDDNAQGNASLENEPGNPNEGMQNENSEDEQGTAIDYSKYIVGTMTDETADSEILDNQQRRSVRAPENDDHSKIIDCEVQEADIEKMVEELLTEEEKTSVSTGGNLRFRVELKRDDENLTDAIAKSVTSVIPESYSIIGMFDTSLFVKIDDAEETLIDKDYSSVTVSFMIPDDIWDEAMIGHAKILRTYVNENGETVTEVVVSEVTDQSIVMDVDNFSSYTLASDIVTGFITEEDDCWIHWLILLMLILSVSSVVIYYRKKRKNEEYRYEHESDDERNKKKDRTVCHYLILVLFNGTAVILFLFGKCHWDIIALAATVISTVGSEGIGAYRYRRYKKKLAKRYDDVAI